MFKQVGGKVFDSTHLAHNCIPGDSHHFGLRSVARVNFDGLLHGEFRMVAQLKNNRVDFSMSRFN